MKKFLTLFIYILFFQYIEAQERYVDSLYEVKQVQTEIYSEKDSEKLIVDIYEPNNSIEKRPVIIFMHGGGFAGGSPKNEAEVKFAKSAASNGYVVGLISYRLLRKGKAFDCEFSTAGKIETFQQAAIDFLDAVKFMKNNSKKYNLNSEKIIVGGSSAGAEAVLNAVYNPDLMFKNPDIYKDIKYSAVISLAGAVVDVRYLNKENAIPGVFFHGTGDNLVPYATAAHHYCSNNDAGYLILDGSKSIVEKLQQLEISYLFYSFKDAGHEISGIPFEYLQQVFKFLKEVVFENTKIQSSIYK